MGLFSEDEIKRKAFHLLTLIYVTVYWFAPRWFTLWGMGVAIAITLILETLRLRFPEFNRKLLGFLGGVHRGGEVDRMSGLAWTLSGAFLTMLLFGDRNIVTASMLYTALGDAFAALVGRSYGRIRFVWGKTLEGSAACFVVCLAIGFAFLDWRLAVFGAFVATLAELVPWPLNDNFWLPGISALSLTLFAAFAI
ncbi:MAG: hypothetical protein JW803_01230 [Endomicrobiales bacterium]|nr:hypothetical protein [Endomicrobiales bacterium]